MKLQGADPGPSIMGREGAARQEPLFIGNDPKKWRTDVPEYARVEYEDVYPGVSLTYYGNESQFATSSFPRGARGSPAAAQL